MKKAISRKHKERVMAFLSLFLISVFAIFAASCESKPKASTQNYFANPFVEFNLPTEWKCTGNEETGTCSDQQSPNQGVIKVFRLKAPKHFPTDHEWAVLKPEDFKFIVTEKAQLIESGQFDFSGLSWVSLVYLNPQTKQMNHYYATQRTQHVIVVQFSAPEENFKAADVKFREIMKTAKAFREPSTPGGE